ncbi:MAG TPA: NAD(P)H-hydrate dehydratase [Candidatus Limnocylindria bacterium]|nr:NAD(P)H-hydrate dehydratase [Candidatus Limnocylindria bacterium]
MQPVFTAEQMRAVDARAIRELGIFGAVLMENAGRGAAAAILAALPELGVAARAPRVVIVCGKGGNAGDGFVVARSLKRARARVQVWLTSPARDIAGEARAKYDALGKTGIVPHLIDDGTALAAALASADVVVDALLGTGARGAPTPSVARAIGLINASGRPVVALDVPSGLPADGGSPPGPAVRAALTTTFAGVKLGLVTQPGAALAGRVRVVDIGVPAAEVGRGIDTFLLERSDIAPLFPPRARHAHKGTYGHLLLVAGSVGKTGAAALAARGAMRAGAGLVTVATACSQQPVLASLILEAMTEPLAETAARSIAFAAREAIVELAHTRQAVAVGPGLGLDEDTRALVRALARELRRPLVVDADALTALAGHLDDLRDAPAPRCLTPHPGEMARLLGATVGDVERDRVASARRLATTYGVHVVLKGATSVIGHPDGRVVLNPTGNPGMASGGTGDVLTGILGAFLARGMEPGVAMQAAVYLHGRAGDRAAARVGEESLIAGDVIEALPEAFRDLADGG